MKLMPSSTTRRSVAMAWSRLGGSPQTPGPVIRMAPNPSRLTVRSPPTSMVPAAAAVGCASTRYLLLVTLSLSRLSPRAGGDEGTERGLRDGPRVARERTSSVRATRGEPEASRLVPLLLVVPLLVVRRRGRPAGYGDIGLEMGRQEGLVRLLESAENLVDPDRFHVNGVGLLVLVLAEQHKFVFSRLCLSGDLDEQVPALAHPDRPGQHFRADDAGVAALRAAHDHRELPAALVGPPGYDAQRGARRRRRGPGHGRAGRHRSGQAHRGACRHGRDGGSEGALQFPPRADQFRLSSKAATMTGRNLVNG